MCDGSYDQFSEYYENTIMNKTIVRKSLGYEFIKKDLRGAIIKGVREIMKITLRPPSITIVMHPNLFTKLHIIEYRNERLFFYEWLRYNLNVLQIIQDIRMNGNVFRIEYGSNFYDVVLMTNFKEGGLDCV